MKRFGYLILITFLTNIVSGQNIDSLGIDNNPLLNKYESEFLENQLESESFDFTNKKVAYYLSLVGLQTKKDFFGDSKTRTSNGQSLSLQIIVLNSEEKIETGGIDAIIIAWSKKQVTPKMRENILKELIKAST